MGKVGSIPNHQVKNRVIFSEQSVIFSCAYFSACGCNGPDQVCDVRTGKCECPENTVGRTCLPCQCNNNTDKCLRNGECLECQFNTTGFYCQHCDTGTFGNAVDQQCQGKVIACNTTKKYDTL